MATKTSAVHPKTNYPTRPSVRWVKKANMWCKTWFEDEKQKQEWSQEKPNG